MNRRRLFCRCAAVVVQVAIVGTNVGLAAVIAEAVALLSNKG
jgi:hypothetical protein